MQLEKAIEEWRKLEKELTLARADNARKDAALRYVLEDDGLIPRATSKCRAVVAEALQAKG